VSVLRDNLDENGAAIRMRSAAAVAYMVAPNPDRCKPLVAVPRAAIQLGHALLVVARPDSIRLRLGRDVRLLAC
jgi:hypothetical protein